MKHIVQTADGFGKEWGERTLMANNDMTGVTVGDAGRIVQLEAERDALRMENKRQRDALVLVRDAVCTADTFGTEAFHRYIWGTWMPRARAALAKGPGTRGETDE